MLCPNCKQGEIQQQISIRGIVFKKKYITSFCPLCGFNNEVVFDLSKDDVAQERILQLQREKNTTYKNSKYSQFSGRV